MTSIPHAVEVCSEHYSFKDRSSCFRCPIQNECQIQVGASQEALDVWREKLEAAATQAAPALRRPSRTTP